MFENMNDEIFRNMEHTPENETRPHCGPRGCRKGPHHPFPHPEGPERDCRRPEGPARECHRPEGMPGRGFHGPMGPMGRPFPLMLPRFDPNSLMGLWIRSHKALERMPMDHRGTRRVLRLLDLGGGSLSQRELTELMDVQPGSLSELLGKMEARGLITRVRLEEDHRKVTVSLTDSGKERAARRGPGDIFSVLDESEKEQLKALLAKLTAAWEGRPQSGPANDTQPQED